MIDVWMATVGPFVLAGGVLITVGALLSRFGVRTFISPSRMDHRPEYLALGAANVLSGIGVLTDARGAFWPSAFYLPAMALFVTALALQFRSGQTRSKNGNQPG
jgi:hypothetical protein